MKKILTIAAVLLGNVVWGQVTLEHTYSTRLLSVENIEGEGKKYAVLDKTINTLNIYNIDHSLYKTISTSLAGNPTVAPLGLYLSKGLFDLDGKLEFVFMLATSGSYSLYVVNEDGVVLFSTPQVNGYSVEKVDGLFKLLVSKPLGTFHDIEVYSLPGQYTGLKPDTDADSETNIFPNPFETSATISYRLPEGQKQSTLSIYNSNGSLVKQMIVTRDFTNVLIQRGDLPSGTYIYDVAGTINRFVIK